MNPIESARPYFRAISPLILVTASLGALFACETGDNFNSEVQCRAYCSKSFACDEVDPSASETGDCVAACRDSIENECGNEHQAAANAQIGECVDMGCLDFRTCMIFETAPECYGFVD